MTNATFHNFTDKPFTGWWNGKAKTFPAGARQYMPAYLAEHFAKHLTNQELIANKKEVYVSPKNPGQVPEFMAVFKKAFIPDTASASGSEIDQEIASAAVPSMSINVQKPKVIEQGPAAALADAASKEPAAEMELGPGKDAQIINGPAGGDDDESGFDHNAN